MGCVSSKSRFMHSQPLMAVNSEGHMVRLQDRVGLDLSCRCGLQYGARGE